MPSAQPRSRELFIGRGAARLYLRDIGNGTPIVVVHGGPGFDHEYLLPDMDRLAESYRLVYYDQRGRGRSYSGQGPDDVTMRSEVGDLDRIRAWLGVESVPVLGHSWGGFLAMNYAAAHPGRLSHLILMNTAPASHLGNVAVQREIERRRSPEQSSRLRAIAASPEFQAGDLSADSDYFRHYFGSAFRRREVLEQMIGRLRAGFDRESVVAARRIANRLEQETWNKDGYDLTARLAELRVPTLLIHGDDDFIPLDVVRTIARAIDGARLVVLPSCGHFAYVDQPEMAIATIAEFLG